MPRHKVNVLPFQPLNLSRPQTGKGADCQARQEVRRSRRKQSGDVAYLQELSL
jgi:hypothetical protein